MASTKYLVRPLEDIFYDTSPRGLLSQVEWIKRSINLEPTYIPDLIGLPNDGPLKQWGTGYGGLSCSQQTTLQNFLALNIRLFEVCDFEIDALKTLYRHLESPVAAAETHPWAGMTLHAYLAKERDAGISAINRWLSQLRFGDPM